MFNTHFRYRLTTKPIRATLPADDCLVDNLLVKKKTPSGRRQTTSRQLFLS